MISLTFIPILLPTLLLHADAIRFDIQNPQLTLHRLARRPPHSGDRHLDSRQTWTLDFQGGPRLAKIWACTNCIFGASGRSSCLTGDCGGQLNYTSYGLPPHTKAEYGLDSFGQQDYYDVSIMDGYNVVVEMTPTTNGCTQSAKCAVADIVEQCPDQLKAPGDCNNPYIVKMKFRIF